MSTVSSLRLRLGRLIGWLDLGAERALSWDERTLVRVSETRSLRHFHLLLLVATYLGYGYVWALLGLTLIVFGGPKDHANVLISLGVVIVTIFICQMIKGVVSRPRPAFDRSGFHQQFLTESSFPSNHTAVAFAMAYTVLQLYPAWHTALVLYCLAFLIGLSRVYLREHYPLDVLGGAVLGTYVAHGLLPWLTRFVV